MFNKLIFILMIPAFLWAQNPSISGFTGTPTHKGSITISGSDFGSKSPAVPLIYDNFESGSVGGVVKGVWQQQSNTVYQDDYRRRNDTQSAFSDFTTNDEPNGGLIKNGGLNARTLYVSYWYRFTTTHADGYTQYSRNIKLCSARHDNDGAEWSSYNTWVQNSYISKLRTTCNQDVADVKYYGGSHYNNDGNWHHYQAEIKVGTSGSVNALRNNYFDGQLAASQSVPTDATTSCQINWLGVWFYFAHSNEPGGDYPVVWGKVWIDEVYVDDTRARVVVSNNVNLANATHVEVQRPSAWSNTSITITMNQGTSSGQNYLHVIDSDGNASSGYSFTWNEDPPPPPEEAAYIIDHPQDVVVQEGEDAVFRVTAGGTEPISYQWQRNTGSGWNNVAGATGSMHTEYGCQLSEDGDLFRCYVENGYGNDTSNAAELSVQAESVPKAEMKVTIHEITKQPK